MRGGEFFVHSRSPNVKHCPPGADPATMARTRWRVLGVIYGGLAVSLVALVGVAVGLMEAAVVALLVLVVVPAALLSIGVLLIGSVIVHEAGHWLAAKVLGLPVSGVAVGGGKPVLELQIAGTPWQFGVGKVGGFTSIERIRPGRLPLVRYASFIAAGPLASGLLAASAYLFARSRYDGPFGIAALIVAVTNLQLVVTNLIPFRVRTIDDEHVPNDGLCLFEVLWHRRRIAAEVTASGIEDWVAVAEKIVSGETSRRRPAST